MKEGLTDLLKGTKKTLEVITIPSFVGATLGALDVYNYVQSFRAVPFGEKFDNILYAAVGTVALGYGIYAYLTGKWPFTEIKEREYQPLEWFNEEIGPILRGKGTRWFISPLVKKVIRNGKIATIPADGQERGCDINFVTKDGLDGTLKVQYLWIVPTKKDAKQYFWQWRAQPTTIDEVVKGELSRQIGRIEGPIQAGEYIDIANKKIDYIIEAENEANRELKKVNLGVEVKDFSVLDVKYSERAQRILNLITEAKKEKEASIYRAEGESRAQAIRAEGEKEATRLKAEATKINIDTYVESAKKVVADENITPVLLYLMDLDNNQEVGESGGTVIKTTGLGQFPSLLPLNIKKEEKNK